MESYDQGARKAFNQRKTKTRSEKRSGKFSWPTILFLSNLLKMKHSFVYTKSFYKPIKS